MRIAVTGATGFIGRHVLQALLAHSHDELIVVGRRAPDPDARITFVQADLLADDGHEWLRTHRPSHLLHLAWYAAHGRFWDSPLNRDWREATVALTRAFCEQGGERVVVAGSCAEYDWSGEDYCSEDATPLQPSTRYGREKSRTRERTKAICETGGVSFTWGRVFYPFGPGEDRARLIPSVVEALLERRAPFPVRVGHWRDLMPVEDVAGAFVYLLPRHTPGVLNVCSGVPTRLGDMIERVGEALGRDPRALLALGEDDGEGPRFLVGDNRRLLETGWRPRYDPGKRLQRYACALAQDEPDNRNVVEDP